MRDIVERLLKPEGDELYDDRTRQEAATLITTLTAERDSWKAACMEAREGCNQRSGTIRSLRSHLETSQALVQSMREALEPFAAFADAVRGRRDDFIEVGWIGRRESDGEDAEVNLTAAHFRRAAALSRSEV